MSKMQIVGFKAITRNLAKEMPPLLAAGRLKLLLRPSWRTSVQFLLVLRASSVEKLANPVLKNHGRI